MAERNSANDPTSDPTSGSAGDDSTSPGKKPAVERAAEKAGAKKPATATSGAKKSAPSRSRATGSGTRKSGTGKKSASSKRGTGDDQGARGGRLASRLPGRSAGFASGYETSVVRCAVALLLVAAGIAWIVVYLNVAKEAAEFVSFPGAKKPSDPLPWMSDLEKWNFLIGFALIFVGLAVSAHKKTPLGRGRGVVIGMLGCFLIGLVWIVVFYFVGNEVDVPLMSDLSQYNLLVGIGFMAVGFTFATKWE